MIRVCFLVLGLMMSFKSYSTDVSGNLIDDDTWTAANSPYNIVGDVGIPGDYTLTIEAGVTVNYIGDFKILVFGVIKVNGTEGNAVTFNGNSTEGAKYMLEIRRTNLDNSNIDYVEMTGPQGAIIQGSTSDETQNTGVLNVVGSSFTNSLVLIELSSDAPVAVAAIDFSSCNFDDGRVNGTYISSYDTGYPLRFANSALTNVELEDINVSLNSCEYLNSTFTDIDSVNLSNTTILNTSFSTINTVILSNSKIIESSLIANTVDISNSLFSLSSSSEVTLLEIVSSGSIIDNTLFTGLSSNVGLKQSNTSSSVNITNSTFVDLGTGIEVSKGNTSVNSSNFMRSGNYHIKNSTGSDITATGNYWDSDSPTIIATKIYDQVDDLELGLVDITGYLSTPNTNAPISPPQIVVKSEDGAGGLNITWEANPEADVAGYKIYWGDFKGYSFASTADAGNVLTHNIPGLSISDSVAITAYDNLVDGMTDQLEGHESWFSFAKNVETDFMSFSIPEQKGEAVIDVENHTIDIEVSYGTSPAALIATFELSYGASNKIGEITQESGVTSNDFSNVVTYTVTAEDGVTIQDWTITLSVQSNPAPTVTSFSPINGPVGTSVTITGTNFSTTPSENIVYFGATTGTVTAASETELTVTVPYGATYEPISVLNTELGLIAYSSAPFVVTFEGGGAIDENSFEAKIDYLIGEEPYSVSIGDLDGDGKSDLIVEDFYGNTVSIYRNTSTEAGMISYDTSVDFTTGSEPNSVSIGDIDSDGMLDFVVTNYGSATISIYRNTSTDIGSISYAEKIDYSTGAFPESVSIGDLDGDGKSDLVVTNGGSHTISIYRNTSTEIGVVRFDTSIDIATGIGAKSVLINDLNDDGMLDLIVIDTAIVSIFRNNTSGVGDISFATKLDYEIVVANSVSVGDLDGDGKPELVVANGIGKTVSVFRNISSGIGGISFATKVKYETIGNATSASIGDFDGDGMADLAVTNYDIDAISLFRNNSIGEGELSFASNVDFETGLLPLSASIGDLDGDGKSDLVVINRAGKSISILRNQIGEVSPLIPSITSFSPANGPVGTSVTITGNNFNTTLTENIVYFGATKGEVTLASETELTVTVPYGATYEPISVLNKELGLIAFSSTPFVVTFDGGGVIDEYLFLDEYYVWQGLGPYSVSIGDLNGDGKNDIVVSDHSIGAILVFRNTTNNPNSISYGNDNDLSVGGLSPGSIAIGDLDGDAKPDLVVVNSGNNTLSVLRNISESTESINFSWKIDFSTGEEPVSVAIDDLDNDGKADLVVANSMSNSISLFKNITSDLGEINFSTKKDYATGTDPKKVSIADFNGDGKVDIAVANNGSSVISVFENQSQPGLITYSSQKEFETNGIAWSLSAGDLDQDGRPDLAISNYSSGTISILKNESEINETIDFAAKSNYSTGGFPTSMEIADLDGDGWPDLIVANVSSKFSVFKNISDGTEDISFGIKQDYLTVSESYFVSIGDLNTDGAPDLVIVDEDEHKVSIFRNALGPSEETDFSTYEFESEVNQGAVNLDNHTIEIEVPTGTDISDLVASFILSDGSIATVGSLIQVSSTTSNNFTNPITYTVTAEDGTTTQDWVVTVTKTEAIPSITFITPTSGPIGTEVIITGTNFDTTPANNIVYFGATRATVSVATATELTVSVPAGATYQPITVLVDGLTAYSSLPFVVTFKGGGSFDESSFESKIDFETGVGPESVDLGDFDNDGKIDLAVTASQSSIISAFVNTSSMVNEIGFRSKLDYFIMSNPVSVSTGDLDGDGKLDMVVANSFSNTISVFKNTSAGIGSVSFSEQAVLETGTNPRAVSIGDLDCDGRLDVAVVNHDSKTVSLFLNTSTESITFESRVDYPTGTNPFSISIGDLDGDKKVDLVIANLEENSISIYRNTSAQHGVINFSTRENHSTGAGPSSVCLGDLDGDEITDIVVSNLLSNTVSIFNNTTSTPGTITLSERIDYSTGAKPREVSLGDLNGNNKIDIAVVNFNSNTVSVFENSTVIKGSVTFNAKIDYATETQPGSISIGDLDNDNKPDLIVTNADSKSVSILRNAIESKSSLTETEITSFSLSEQTSAAIIDASNHTIDLEVSNGTNVTAVAPNFILSSSATAKVGNTSQVSGTTQNNFSQPVIYKVTAEDGLAIQDWTVTVTVDGAPEFSSISYDQTYAVGSGGTALTVSITSDNVLSSVYIYYKSLVQSSYQQNVMSLVDGKYIYSFSDNDFDDLGLTFYISVEDINSNLVLSSNQTINTVFSDDTESISGLISSTDPLDYAIISIPFQSKKIAEVFSNLGSKDDGSWKLSHHDGGEQYKYYPTDFSQFEPGKGYWFLSSKPSDFLLKGGTAVPVSDDQPFAIQLRANDWNMIGNPFPYPIDWGAVIDHNANNSVSIESLVTFENRQFNAGQFTMNKYDGALLFSSSDVELEIPISAISNSNGRTLSTNNRNSLAEFDTGEWEIGLNLSTDELAYNVSGIGMKPDASNGRDSYDWTMLPRFNSYLDLSFAKGITKSVVSSTESYTWDFTVNSNLKGKSTKLSWEALDIEHANHSLILLDIEGQQVINMAERNAYEFNVSGGSQAFKLLYAPKEAMQEYMSFGNNFVGDPYPNPSSRDITIPISISHDDSDVIVTIYNILGQEVYQSEQSNISEGYHEFSLKLSEEPLIANHSATYILEVLIQSKSSVSQIKKRIVYTK
ncbi:MAG: FG-GAP-like repeat-containing protein [Reichenbachiella sp.]